MVTLKKSYGMMRDSTLFEIVSGNLFVRQSHSWDIILVYVCTYYYVLYQYCMFCVKFIEFLKERLVVFECIFFLEKSNLNVCSKIASNILLKIYSDIFLNILQNICCNKCHELQCHVTFKWIFSVYIDF